MTGRKKLKLGKKGAAIHSRINPNKGIKDRRASKNNSNTVNKNATRPVRSANDLENPRLLFDFIATDFLPNLGQSVTEINKSTRIAPDIGSPVFI